MTGLYVASNPTALSAQFGLQRNMGDLSNVLTRLSTGLKINSGKDDPAGLIASELLKAQITGTNKAITNTQRANSMISTADSALSQIGSLLNDIKGLVVEGANTSTMNTEQIAANQLQVNAAIDSIDRIAKTTNYGGKKLLDGSLDFRTANSSGGISNLQITSANFGTSDAVGINVNVKQQADYARLTYNGTGVATDTLFEVTGNVGTESINLGAGTLNSEIAAAINRKTDSTGVLAYVDGLASRGTVVLNGTGSNNAIVATAKEVGYEGGNYSFKIRAGEVNDARVVNTPNAASPGQIEITLQQSYSKTYSSFGGILDVNINTGAKSDATALTIKHGEANRAVYHTANEKAYAASTDGAKTLTVNGGDTNSAGDVVAWSDMSKLNGWTVKVVDAGDYAGKTVAAAGYALDSEAKIAYVGKTAAGTADTDFNAALGAIIGDTVSGQVVSLTGTVVAGDEFVLGGGGAAKELEVTYKEGAKVADIQKLINDTGTASARIASGVNADALVRDVLKANTRVSSSFSAADSNTSNFTAKQTLDMLNQKLGSKFDFALAYGEDGSGLMTYMDAAKDYGNVNLDNALRFTGQDDGPIVRLSATDATGKAVANQKLSMKLINPTDEDIRNGIRTQVLQINLATDAAGNSITTAKDIVSLFNKATAAETGGVSASLILPDGVDPNGRTWVDDGAGNITIQEANCAPDYGNGIVQPTGNPGVCAIQQNDLVLLGTNQTINPYKSTARIAPTTQQVAQATLAANTAGNGLVQGTGIGIAKVDDTHSAVWSLTVGLGIDTAPNAAVDGDDAHSILNGVTLVLKQGTAATDENQWDAASGTLTVLVDNAAAAATAAADIGDAIAAAVNANLSNLQTFNGSHAVGNAGVFNATAFVIGGTPNLAALGGDGVTIKVNGGQVVGDVLEYQGKATASGAGGASITTDKMTSALNGVGFEFTNSQGEAGFDKTTGTLTVFLNPLTQGINTTDDRGRFNQAVTDAVNGAIAGNWEGIREYTKTTDTGATVTVNTGTATAADLFTIDGSTVALTARIPGSDTLAAAMQPTAAGNQRGLSVSDPALLLESKVSGAYAGVKVVLQQDSNLAASTNNIWTNATTVGIVGKANIAVDFDEANGVLTIKANTTGLQSSTTGGLDADVLAKALNEDTTFQKYFTASAPANTQNPAPAAGANNATVKSQIAFGNNTVSRATFSESYGITTASNAINPTTATSAGVGMYSNNDANERLIIEAAELGSDQFVSVNVKKGSLNTVDQTGYASTYANGTDMNATINGLKATAHGNNISINTSDLSMSMNVANQVGWTGFDITGGGALMQLGPDVVSAQQMRLGIGSMLSTNLGGASGQLYMLKEGETADLITSDASRKLADRIVNEAISNVAVVRGRLGAIQKGSLEPNVLALQDSLTALTEANAMITNADFAEESSNLTRLQLLIQAGAQTLGIANQLPQYAAQLVR